MKAVPFLVLALLSIHPEGSEVLFAPTGDRREIQTFIETQLRAARTIDIAMFHFTSERLARALVRRRAEGASVRLLLDSAQSDPEFVRKLRDGKVDVRLVTPAIGDARFHHKYCVLDGKYVITGSYNWTYQGDTANHENLILLRDAAVATRFQENFEKTWNDTRLSRP